MSGAKKPSTCYALDGLVLDTWVDIALFLNIDDLPLLVQVSKRFADVFNHEIMWEALLMRSFPHLPIQKNQRAAAEFSLPISSSVDDASRGSPTSKAPLTGVPSFQYTQPSDPARRKALLELYLQEIMSPYPNIISARAAAKQGLFSRPWGLFSNISQMGFQLKVAAELKSVTASVAPGNPQAAANMATYERVYSWYRAAYPALCVGVQIGTFRERLAKLANQNNLNSIATTVSNYTRWQPFGMTVFKRMYEACRPAYDRAFCHGWFPIENLKERWSQGRETTLGEVSIAELKTWCKEMFQIAIKPTVDGIKEASWRFFWELRPPLLVLGAVTLRRMCWHYYWRKQMKQEFDTIHPYAVGKPEMQKKFKRQGLYPERRLETAFRLAPLSTIFLSASDRLIQSGWFWLYQNFYMPYSYHVLAIFCDWKWSRFFQRVGIGLALAYIVSQLVQKKKALKSYFFSVGFWLPVGFSAWLWALSQSTAALGSLTPRPLCEQILAAVPRLLTRVVGGRDIYSLVQTAESAQPDQVNVRLASHAFTIAAVTIAALTSQNPETPLEHGIINNMVRFYLPHPGYLPSPELLKNHPKEAAKIFNYSTIVEDSLEAERRVFRGGLAPGNLMFIGLAAVELVLCSAVAFNAMVKYESSFVGWLAWNVALLHLSVVTSTVNPIMNGLLGL